MQVTAAAVPHQAARENPPVVPWHWSLDENDYHTPAGKQPNDSLVDLNVKTHVQGFVRTNSALHPYAGTHSFTNSDSAEGSLFVIEDNGGFALDTWNNHPSGAAILGARMWFGDELAPDEPYVLRSLVVDTWFDTEQA